MKKKRENLFLLKGEPNYYTFDVTVLLYVCYAIIYVDAEKCTHVVVVCRYDMNYVIFSVYHLELKILLLANNNYITQKLYLFPGNVHFSRLYVFKGFPVIKFWLNILVNTT